MRILHDMALDKDNIVYSLLGSTILANLDRSIRDRFGEKNLLEETKKTKIVHFSTNMSEEKISLNKDIQPPHLPSEISNIELNEAEQKTEEKKESVLENQSSLKKQTNVVNRLMRRVWYDTRPLSDEGDLPDETTDVKGTDDHVDEEKIIAPDIETSHSSNVENDKDSKKFKNETTVPPTPSWINDQVYGDKVSFIPFFKIS